MCTRVAVRRTDPIRKLILGRQRLSVALGLILAIALAGGAFAYWTQGGSGTGSATTGTTVAITVNQTSPITGLYPGGPTQKLSGNFDNPNAGNVYVTSVTAVIPVLWTAQANGSLPACTAADFTIGGSAPVGAEINPGIAQGSWSGLTIAMNDLGTNQDNCKKVSPPINYTAN